MNEKTSMLGYIKKPFAYTYHVTKDRVWPYAMKHKVVSLVVLVVVGYGGYKIEQAYFSTAGETRYVLSRVRTSDISTTVVGTGQVSASNQIDLKANASGAITYIGANTGDTLKAGTIIAKVDARSISLDLASSKIALEKLTQPADSVTLTQAQNDLANAQSNLDSAYKNALTSISSAYIDLPTIINGMNSVFYDSTGFLNDKNTANWNEVSASYRNSAGVTFDLAKNDYLTNANTYRATASSNSTSTIVALLNNTYNTVTETADVLKNAKLATDYIKNHVTGQSITDAGTTETSIDGWTAKNNSHMSDLLSAQSNLNSAIREVEQKKESLAKVMSGNDPLDIQSQQIALAQKELQYENYLVRAPFDGVLAQLTIKQNNTVSGGSTVGVFISKDKIANITLNEVDASKVKIGQPVSLTFDAVDGVTATGTVASIDLVGTVSQGVVTYGAQINFSTTDDRIKPGMSVTATITTEEKDGVIVVPLSAVKTKSGTSYVQVVTQADVQMDDAATAIFSAPMRMRGGYNGSSTNSGASSSTTDTTWSSTTDASSSADFKADASSSDMRRAGASRFAALQQGVLLNSNTTPENRTVVLGISNDTEVEILSGLSQGEYIISKTIASSTKSTTAPSLLSGLGARGGAGGGAARAGGAARGN